MYYIVKLQFFDSKINMCIKMFLSILLRLIYVEQVLLCQMLHSMINYKDKNIFCAYNSQFYLFNMFLCKKKFL